MVTQGCGDEGKGDCSASDLELAANAQEQASLEYDSTGQKQEENRKIAEAILNGTTELGLGAIFPPAGLFYQVISGEHVSGLDVAATVLPFAGAFGASERIAIDSNVLINAIDNGEAGRVESALAGRIPVASPTAIGEYLAKGNSEALGNFMAAHAGQIGSAAEPELVASLQSQASSLGRVLRYNDASIAASAMKDGLALLTDDSRFASFLGAIGWPVVRY